ncbi:MAG: hypothetical protein HC892_07905 [Saprospiraceae bacterium]|nr:hypothetical protein [Saprospiraceae bacterium]
MHPLRILLYEILRLITRIVLWVYYPKTTVIQRKNLKFNRATIIACSHPNTMMDPLHVASRTKKPVHFLANADLFATKFGNWFYSTMFCIPIRRKIDDRGTHVDNTNSFDRVTEFLADGGCLWIAPEGGSFWGRHWLSLKTGTARMALLAESSKQFQLGLAVLPVGLNYEAPNFFRTKLVINVGEPIFAKAYQELYEKDYWNAVKQLTTDLEVALQDLEIAPNDEEEDTLLRRVEIVVQNQYPAANKESFRRSKQLLKRIQAHPNHALETTAEQYFEAIKAQRLTDRAVMHFFERPAFRKVIDWAWLMLGFPLFLFGFVNNALPSFLPYYFTNRRQPWIGYRAIVKMLIGLFAFPFFYTLQTLLVHSFFQTPWLTFLYLASLLPTGMFAWHYAKWAWLLFQRLRIKKIKPSLQQTLGALRKEILGLVMD